jgi:thymidylate kinase
MLFVFEGSNGVGKSTMVNAIRSKYPNIYCTHYPNFKGLHGQEIKKGLKIARMDKEFDQLFLDNILHEQNVISSLLSLGIDVLIDRYVWSTVVYAKLRGNTISLLTYLTPNVVFLFIGGRFDKEYLELNIPDCIILNESFLDKFKVIDSCIQKNI